MIDKKGLRITAAAVLAGAAIGAHTAHGATASHVHVAAASGTVTITDYQFPDGCNPIATASVVQQEVCGGTMEDSLFLLDDRLTYQPDLALNVPSTRNGEVKIAGGKLLVTYRLKPNLKWSDGAPLTVDDFIFSVLVNIDAGNSAGLDQIQSMRKVDATTVVVTYKGQYAPFVAYGNPQPLLPRHYLIKKYGTSDPKAVAAKFLLDTYNSPSDVFSGAFKIGSWTAGSEIDLTPNPYYTALPPAPGHARLAGFRFKSYVGATAGSSALAVKLLSPQTDADQAEDFQYNDIALLRKSNYQVTSLPALYVEHLELNQGGVLKDVRLRQALQAALDKAALFKTVFPDLAGQTNDYLLHTVLPNLSPFDDKSEAFSAYNPQRARALLKTAGYSYRDAGGHLIRGAKGQLYLNFATTSTTIRQQVEGLIAQSWARVGITTNPHFTTSYGNGGLFSDYSLNGVLYRRSYDVALFAFQESPDPQQGEFNFLPQYIPTAAYHGGAEQNYNGIGEDPHDAAARQEADLLIKARDTVDAAQRRTIFNQWQRVCNQQVYWIMLYARQNIAAHKNTFGPYRPNPSQATNEWNAYEWFKS